MSRSCVTVASTNWSNVPNVNAIVGSALLNASATSRSTIARVPGAVLTVSRTVAQNSDGLRCAMGTYIVASMPSRGVV